MMRSWHCMLRVLCIDATTSCSRPVLRFAVASSSEPPSDVCARTGRPRACWLAVACACAGAARQPPFGGRVLRPLDWPRRLRHLAVRSAMPTFPRG